MRKKDDRKKLALLDCARRIECEEGVEAVSIRRLAAESHVAVGTVYNYFDSKQAVLYEITEEYWRSALLKMQSAVTGEKFTDQIRQVYAFLALQMDDCAKLLMLNLREGGETPREKMAVVQNNIRKILFERLQRDRSVRSDVWNGALTQDSFVQFVLGNLLALLRQKNGDIDTLVEIMERILY